MNDTPDGSNGSDTENTPGGNAAQPNGAAPQAGAEGQAMAPQLRVLTQYIHDLSFENPNAPASLSAEAQQGQEVNVGVDVQARKMENNSYECMLKIQAAVKKGNTPHFIIELAYSGVFLLENLPEGADHAVMLIEAPRILFPFARRIVADTTRDGGFQPLMLDPIDFAQLYRQQMAQQAAQAAGQMPPAAEGPAQA